MTSVLFAKNEAPTYHSAGIERAFRENFKEVSVFNWQQAKFSEGKEGMQQRLIFKAESEKPDIIFLHIQSPDALDTYAMSILSEIAFTVLYTFDVREDIQWYKDLAPYVNLILFGDLQSVNEYKAAGFLNAEYMHSSADFDVYKRLPPSGRKIGTPPIIFIGGKYSNSSHKFPLADQRTEMVEFMKKHFKKNFQAYGPGFSKEFVNMQDEVVLYNSAKIAITQNQFNRAGYTSDRIWRSMGCGCFTLSQYYMLINKDFNVNCLATWLDFTMLAEQCEKWLSNEDSRKAVAEFGYEWVRLHHSWSMRIKQLKNLILQNGFQSKRAV